MVEYFGVKSIFYFCFVAIFFSAFPHSADGIECYECDPGVRDGCSNVRKCPREYKKCSYAWNSKSGETANGCSDEADKDCGAKGHFAVTNKNGKEFVGDHGCVCKTNLCNKGSTTNTNLNGGGPDGKGKGSNKATSQKANALIYALSFVFSLISRIFNF